MRDSDTMPVMNRNLVDFAKELRALGIDDAIVALATAAVPHVAFEYRCQAVDDPKVDNGGEPPPGPPFTTLWECNDTVTGFWRRDGGIEFIEFDIEAPEDYHLISRSTQGLFAWTFFWLVEDEDWDDAEAALGRLREAALAVGFVHLDDVLRIQEAGSSEQYLAFARSL
jgi:hypothetical protein